MWGSSLIHPGFLGRGGLRGAHGPQGSLAGVLLRAEAIEVAAGGRGHGGWLRLDHDVGSWIEAMVKITLFRKIQDQAKTLTPR